MELTKIWSRIKEVEIFLATKKVSLGREGKERNLVMRKHFPVEDEEKSSRGSPILEMRLLSFLPSGHCHQVQLTHFYPLS